MENLVEHVMQEADIKSRGSGESNSVSISEDESLLSLIDMISSRRSNLLDLVILLEKYHTKGDVEQRAKSISIIGTVIHEVANLDLDSKACVGLSKFFVSKLRDVHWVLPSMKAIYGLLKYHPESVKSSQQSGDQCLTKLLTGISSPSIHIPAYNQKVRIVAFKWYETILLQYNEFFKLQDDDVVMDITNETSSDESKTIPYSTLVSAILTAIESEKDPRNLIESFKLTYLILSKFGNDPVSSKTIEPFLDEIFENISCYYPIEFEPPKNDKFKITPKDLKDGLNKCFIASPLISHMIIPFVLDKLTSANLLAKAESLNTLKLMIEELPIQKIREFCEIISNHLQNEAFNFQDEGIQTLWIETIAQLWAVLNYSKDRYKIVQFDSISEKVISVVLERCSQELEKDPDTITGILASNILWAIMKKSFSLWYLVVDTFLINFWIESINAIKILNQ